MSDKIVLMEGGRDLTWLLVEAGNSKIEVRLTDQELTTLAANATQIIESRLRSRVYDNCRRQAVVSKAKDQPHE